MKKESRYGSYVSVLCATLAVVGCNATAPDLAIGPVKDMAPGRWTATAASKSGVDHDWVARLGDKRLTRLVREAIASTPDMRVAAERMEQSRQNAKLAGVALQPTLNTTLNTRRNKVNFIGSPFSGSTVTDNHSLSFDVSWRPDLWGRNRAVHSAAIGKYQASQQDFRAAKTLLAANICRAWFALAEAQEQKQLAQKALEIRIETKDAVERRFEQALAAEGGSASQLRLSQTDIATAKAAVAQRKGEVEAAKRQLEILLGNYPAAKIAGPTRVPTLSSRPPAGLPSELLLRRPDIIAAERRYAASKKRVKEAELAYYPTFTLTGSAGTSSDSLRNILDSNFGVWSLGKSLFVPILTGGQIEVEKANRYSGERQALASLQSTVITAFGEVENALANEKWLVRRINDFNEAHRLAIEAAKAASVDYAEGTGDVLTLFNAQTQRITIASQIATLRRLRADNRVTLHLALGGGFQLSKSK